jgi:hypothetical protein
MKNKIKNFVKSDLSVNDFFRLSEQPFFSRSIKERSKYVDKPKYKGFKYSVHYDSSSNKLILFVNLYFFIKGAKNKKTGKKELYLLTVKFPYIKDLKTFKNIYNSSIQIFSSDPSFKYFFAFVLNKHNAVVLDEKEFKNFLDISLTNPPKVKNPNWKIQLTKHLYKLFLFLKNVHPAKYLDKKWEINASKTVTINKNGNPVSF